MVITWNSDTGAPMDLTGASLSARIFRYSTQDTVNSAGVFNVLIPTGGVFEWVFDSSDVIAGSYRIQFVASFGSGLTPLKSDQLEWEVTQSL